jgi:hypothetical protein
MRGLFSTRLLRSSRPMVICVPVTTAAARSPPRMLWYQSRMRDTVG